MRVLASKYQNQTAPDGNGILPLFKYYHKIVEQFDVLFREGMSSAKGVEKQERGRRAEENVEGRREIAVDVKKIDLTRMKGIEGIRNSQIVIPEILPKA